MTKHLASVGGISVLARVAALWAFLLEHLFLMFGRTGLNWTYGNSLLGKILTY